MNFKLTTFSSHLQSQWNVLPKVLVALISHHSLRRWMVALLLLLLIAHLIGPSSYRLLLAAAAAVAHLCTDSSFHFLSLSPLLLNLWPICGLLNYHCIHLLHSLPLCTALCRSHTLNLTSTHYGKEPRLSLSQIICLSSAVSKQFKVVQSIWSVIGRPIDAYLFGSDWLCLRWWW